MFPIHHLLAQVDPITLSQGADFIANKDLKWWFAALLILFVGSGLYIFRIMLTYHNRYIESLVNQLTDQRTQNNETNAKYMSYLATDRLETTAIIKEVAAHLREFAVLTKEVSETLSRVQDRLDKPTH